MWAVVVKNGKNKQTKVFTEYEEAEEYYGKAKQLEEQKKNIIVRLVSRLKVYEPEGKKPKGNKVKWCPYCGRYERFINHPEYGYISCNICEISDRDYWVKKYNSIFISEMASVKKNLKE